MQPNPHVRWLIRRDLPEVLAIDEESFSTPWVEENFLAALRQRNTIGMVTECDEAIAGYMIYELHKKKLELIRFAVGSNYRRRGFGTALMARLVSKLSGHRRTRVACSVSEVFTGAHLFFKAIDWRACRVDRGNGEQGEDTYRFSKHVAAEQFATAESGEAV